MTEEIADLFGVTVKTVAKAAQWIAALIGIVAFLVFFASAPLHALILSGLLIVLASLFFKAEKDVQKTALYIGTGLMMLGIAGIFIPQMAKMLLSLASQLEKLLVYPA